MPSARPGIVHSLEASPGGVPKLPQGEECALHPAPHLREEPRA